MTKTCNEEKFIRICQADQQAETGEGVCCQAAEEGLLRDDWDGGNRKLTAGVSFLLNLFFSLPLADVTDIPLLNYSYLPICWSFSSAFVAKRHISLVPP
jgi:hypothetical protein